MLGTKLRTLTILDSSLLGIFPWIHKFSFFFLLFFIDWFCYFGNFINIDNVFRLLLPSYFTLPLSILSFPSSCPRLSDLHCDPFSLLRANFVRIGLEFSIGV